ncbi:peptide-methionine (S)-S-oxide reductase MsrA [Leptonema illini]|uniref:Peptide methionine sulfoxide reductase MsrA n=1 Tax=Leptonema illini DSM 21528 TaxID=929563 RepID=H2CGS1_9LEPT|nr:peptide-methionine (S)-S-oxide reductase MsrA [Leptonema illini]EHQ04747.1 Peptide methionine sulfoxide reductase msrA [Leptonema illini DSM 21528]
MKLRYLFSALLILISCGPSSETTGKPAGETVPAGASIAIFAGGCFWCMEGPFEKLDGVYAVESGYTGGKEVNPSYEEVSAGITGHVEAVRIFYDAKKVTFEQLLDTYWMQIDPTDKGGQFADRGRQYRPVLFYANEKEKAAILASREKLEKSKRFSAPIVVAIEPAGPFYRAEEYHQDYYKKNPDHYNRYREGSGRGPFLRRIWQ